MNLNNDERGYWIMSNDFKTAKDAGGPGVGYEDKVRKGQALNLAVAVAVSEGKQLDNKFIIQQVARFLKLSTTIQNSSAEDIIRLVGDK